MNCRRSTCVKGPVPAPLRGEPTESINGNYHRNKTIQFSSNDITCLYQKYMVYPLKDTFTIENSFYILMCLCHFRIKHVRLTFSYRKCFVILKNKVNGQKVIEIHLKEVFPLSISTNFNRKTCPLQRKY